MEAALAKALLFLAVLVACFILALFLGKKYALKNLGWFRYVVGFALFWLFLSQLAYDFLALIVLNVEEGVFYELGYADGAELIGYVVGLGAVLFLASWCWFGKWWKSKTVFEVLKRS